MFWYKTYSLNHNSGSNTHRSIPLNTLKAYIMLNILLTAHHSRHFRSMLFSIKILHISCTMITWATSVMKMFSLFNWKKQTLSTFLSWQNKQAVKTLCKIWKSCKLALLILLCHNGESFKTYKNLHVLSFPYSH